MNQDKGQPQMLRAFFDSIQKNTPAPIPLNEWLLTSLVTFAILESLRTRLLIAINPDDVV